MVDTPLSLAEPPRPRPNWVLTREPVEVPPRLELDPSQQAVVDHRSGALLVLAGPGTGKTQTLTEAVVARLQDDPPLAADQVLVLTFARKAAIEIRDRIVSRRGGGEVPTVCTFHSLALAIVREFGGDSADGLRLLTAPEQELIVQEVLRTLIAEQAAAKQVQWPTSLEGAVSTRGLAVEVRNALARARSLGLNPGRLREAAATAQQPEWDAVGQLLDVYLEVSAQQRLLDYNELILAALELAAQPAVQDVLQRRYRAIFVDEYQDTDPLQIRLLQQLTSADATLVAVGDPDQSIYGFRGADPSSVKRFASDFAHMNASAPPAATALSVNRRATAELRAAAHRLIERAGAELLPTQLQSSHRELITPAELAAGSPPVYREYESAEVEAEEVAEEIRRIVLAPNSGYTWRDVAVLVRSGTRSIPVLQRALIQADVPVVSTYDDLPLASEPAVRALMLALRCAANPQRITEHPNAHDLLTSELARLDPADIRRLSRLVRDDCPGFSAVRMAEALADAKVGAGVSPEVGGDAWQRFVHLRDLLARANAQYRRGATIHELLWLLWSGTDWPERLRHRALAEGVTAASANHDLDVVMTLMELAADSSYRPANSGQLANFINTVSDLLVPEQPASPAVSPNAVSLMTAHRSKGLEWPVVFVCSADEQTWPDLRRRNSLFEPDRLRVIDTADGAAAELGAIPERQAIVAEERRLFYVACTRAKRELHVSSTSADRDLGKLPSRFLKQLLPNAEQVQDSEETIVDLELGRRPHYSANSLVAQLRRIGTSPNVTAAERSAAARRLAYLAKLEDHQQRRAVPAADPRAWWGVAESTRSSNPVEPVGQPVYIRGSSMHQLQDCALRWFLEQRIHADEPKGMAMVFGSVIHACADAVIRGEVPPDREQIIEKLNAIWQTLRHEADWEKGVDFAAAGECIDSFLRWRQGRPDTIDASHSEVGFIGNWPLVMPDGTTDFMELRGKIDVVELHHDGGIYIVDFKTSKTMQAYKKAESNPQLAVYQTAANQGLLDWQIGESAESRHSIGAELVYLRTIDDKPGPQMRPQSPVADWFTDLAASSVAQLRAEDYQPTASSDCEECPFKSLCPVFAAGKPVLP